MPQEKIQFFAEDIDFVIKNKKKIREWIAEVVKQEQKKIKSVNVIFCSEAHLLTINQDFLKHDFHTDIITFDYSEDPNLLEGELYISIDMVKSNAEDRKIDFELELYRVVVHGFLHMIGYEDKSEPKQKTMSQKEDLYLKLIDF